MAQVPTGTTFAIASALAAAKTVTDISNADPAVVDCTAHGFTTNDVVLFTSGWGRVHLRAFKVTNIDTDSFSIQGLDSTNTTIYPAGSGAGTVSKITTWSGLAGIMNPQTSGGDPKTATYKFVESDIEFSINDGFAATNYTLEMDADQIGGSGYTACVDLTDVQTNTVLRMTTKNGAPMFLGCTVAMNEAVRLQEGQINRVLVAFNGTNRSVRYAS